MGCTAKENRLGEKRNFAAARVNILSIMAVMMLSVCFSFPAFATDLPEGWLSEERFLDECNAMKRTTPQFCSCANEKVYQEEVNKALAEARETMAFKAKPIEDMNARLQEDPAVNDERIAEICHITEDYLSLLNSHTERKTVEKTYQRVTREIADKVKEYGFNEISATYLSSPQTYCYHVKIHKEESANFKANIELYERKNVKADTRRIVMWAGKFCN
jgi:hypothetical protein